MVTDRNTNLVPIDSTHESAQVESVEQKEKEVNMDSQLKTISHGNANLAPTERKPQNWNELFFHAASTITMGGIGTFFHIIHAPTEVMVLILIVEVIFIINTLKLIVK